MSGDDNPKRIKHRYVVFAVLLVVFAIIVFIAVSLISGSAWLKNMFSPRVSEISVDEFNFNVGRARMFATLDNSIAAVGTLGIMVLDYEGNEALRASFRMTQPAIKSSGSRCIVFDIGGTTVRVFDSTQVISSIEASGVIVSASINQNGWFCLVTQEGSGYRGVVTVYDNLGSVVYRVNIASGFVLSAELSPDNNNLAILNLTETGSRITFYNDIATEDEPAHRFDYSGGLILEFVYKQNGDILVFSSDLLFIIESSGENKILYTYHENRLGAYAYDDNFIALHIYDYGVGLQGRLITLRTDGTILGETVIAREIASMSAVDKSLVILKSDGITFYDELLEEFAGFAEDFSAAGANRVLAVSTNVALATSDNSAVIVRREEER